MAEHIHALQTYVEQTAADANLSNVTDQGLVNITGREIINPEGIREVSCYDIKPGDVILDFKANCWDSTGVMNPGDERNFIVTKDTAIKFSLIIEDPAAPEGYFEVTSLPYTMNGWRYGTFDVWFNDPGRPGESSVNMGADPTFIIQGSVDKIATQREVDKELDNIASRLLTTFTQLPNPLVNGVYSGQIITDFRAYFPDGTIGTTEDEYDISEGKSCILLSRDSIGLDLVATLQPQDLPYKCTETCIFLHCDMIRASDGVQADYVEIIGQNGSPDTLCTKNYVNDRISSLREDLSSDDNNLPNMIVEENLVSIGTGNDPEETGGFTHGVGIGTQSFANANSVAIGNQASAELDSVAIGTDAVAEYDMSQEGKSCAIGASARSSSNGIAIGYNASAYPEAIAIGSDTVTADGGIAIGYNTDASARSIVIGNNFSNDGDDALSVAPEGTSILTVKRDGAVITSRATTAEDSDNTLVTKGYVKDMISTCEVVTGSYDPTTAQCYCDYPNIGGRHAATQIILPKGMPAYLKIHHILPGGYGGNNTDATLTYIRTSNVGGSKAYDCLAILDYGDIVDLTFFRQTVHMSWDEDNKTLTIYDYGRLSSYGEAASPVYVTGYLAIYG